MSTGFTPTSYTFAPAQIAIPGAVVQVNTVTFNYQGGAAQVGFTVYASSADLAAGKTLSQGMVSVPNSALGSTMTELISDIIAAGLSFADNSGSSVSTSGATAF